MSAQYPKVSIAPMMAWTTRHYRYMMRQITQYTLLYTEMVTTGALIHGDRERFLAYAECEHPIALQLGGSNANDLATCAKFAQSVGFDEVNLNVGCPSDRVQSGAFGLCLMKTPDIVAQAVSAMQEAVDIPVTVKTRIGVDEYDSEAYLLDFVGKLVEAGLKHLIIHARKGWLKGLSPKENRHIPPLCYERVYQIKAAFPELIIGINGGVETLADIQSQLGCVDSVMIGRAAWYDPYFMATVDQQFFDGNAPPKSRVEVVQAMLPYIEENLSLGVPLKTLTMPLMNLFHAQPKGKLWRRYLSENAHLKGGGVEVVEAALNLIRE